MENYRRATVVFQHDDGEKETRPLRCLLDDGGRENRCRGAGVF